MIACALAERLSWAPTGTEMWYQAASTRDLVWPNRLHVWTACALHQDAHVDTLTGIMLEGSLCLEPLLNRPLAQGTAPVACC